MLVQDSSKPTEPVTLRVHAEDAGDAREILDASVEIDDVPREPLEDEEHCRRCWSTEIHLVTRRAAAFAGSLLGIIAAFFLLSAIRGAFLYFGHQLSITFQAGFLAVTAVLPFGTALWFAVAPKKRCRNCGLEWRGTPRPS